MPTTHHRPLPLTDDEERWLWETLAEPALHALGARMPEVADLVASLANEPYKRRRRMLSPLLDVAFDIDEDVSEPTCFAIGELPMLESFSLTVELCMKKIRSTQEEVVALGVTPPAAGPDALVWHWIADGATDRRLDDLLCRARTAESDSDASRRDTGTGLV